MNQSHHVRLYLNSVTGVKIVKETYVLLNCAIITIKSLDAEILTAEHVSKLRPDLASTFASQFASQEWLTLNLKIFKKKLQSKVQFSYMPYKAHKA